MRLEVEDSQSKRTQSKAFRLLRLKKAAARMFMAASVSRSCSAPHSEHVHSLIPRFALPFGLLAGIIPQLEQVWVEYDSLTYSNMTDRAIALYSNCVLSICQPASRTDFAILVLTNLDKF